ncbi:MAG: SIMPL domain-containing protein [Alphaproteobacteria bacterium]|uniref:SIMPL domain-containing protein n=1 Tax=Maricaulis alexandrii TaxID=2570354 RepID=UPI0014869A29|nr:SIMPL domain-containing protein [Maricaulis alexandrii]MCR9267587.1 SIMPL domain-containing protein [Alphaproteobacteria bacterium]
MLRTLLVSTAALASFAAPSALAQSEAALPSLNLSASAEVQMAPDYASVSSGVVSRAETAQQAVRENARTMDAVFSALRRAGVEPADMQTSQLSVSPVYAENRSNNQVQRDIIGYEVRNTVSATIRDTRQVGQVIDAMVSAGANNINSVSFGAEDTADALNEARRTAIANLMSKADLFAEAAGFELCGIRSMSENSYAPQPVYRERAYAMGAMDSATPVAAGELTLTATVNASFCIDS